ncbi:hypothetical protein [Streptomyces sp. NPDC005507]
MTTFQNQVAAEATIAEQAWTAALGAVTVNGRVVLPVGGQKFSLLAAG